MATVTKPMALDRSMNTTEQSPRNVADVLAQELSGIATAISGGSDKVPKTDIATVEPTNVASRAYNVGELVYVNGNLYKVITSISGGATFTVGTNIQSTNVSEGLRGGLVKSASFSGTTNIQGNVEMSVGSLPIIIVKINEPQYICFPFIYADDSTYIRVLDVSTGDIAVSVSVTGTYYYIEE